jgi:hypothetical protein
VAAAYPYSNQPAGDGFRSSLPSIVSPLPAVAGPGEPGVSSVRTFAGSAVATRCQA